MNLDHSENIRLHQEWVLGKTKLTNSQKEAELAKLDGKDNQWVIMKHGLYYRPNGHGYTNNLDEAWLVSEEIADKHTYPYDEPVTKHRAPYPDYLNSYDAIIPLIQKQEVSVRQKIGEELLSADRSCLIILTRTILRKPDELADALLKAHGFEV